jgi:M6 family metalloprotease-like protein
MFYIEMKTLIYMRKFFVHIILFLTVFICFTETLQAQTPKRSVAGGGIPACPVAAEITADDGSKVSLKLKGDKAMHWYETSDGYSVFQTDSSKYVYAMLDSSNNLVATNITISSDYKHNTKVANFVSKTAKNLQFSKTQVSAKRNSIISKSTASYNAFPSVGTRKVLLLLIDYTDKPFIINKEEFENLMNQSNYKGTGSFKDYYAKNSFGKLELTTTVCGWYHASKTMAYYGSNDSRGNDVKPEALVSEAIDQAEADGVNFADYDNDGDGYVDDIQVIHAGYGEENSNALSTYIWSHSGSLGLYSRTYDGVKIQKYAIYPELRGISGTRTTNIGVICHEFGHSLGLPDLYDTDYSSNGLAEWDLMANGSWNNNGASPANHGAWSKAFMNWIKPVEISTAQSVALQNAEENSVAYKIKTNTLGEYYLLENRQAIDNEAFLPGHGLLIFHVDDNYIDAHLMQNDVNDYDRHNGLDLIEADNSSSSASLSGDPFPGNSANTLFTDTSTPKSVLWDGSFLSKPITDISENTSTNLLYFKFMNGGIKPAKDLKATPEGSTQINVQWTKNEDNNHVILLTNTQNNFGKPQIGKIYATGDVLTSGDTILYVGSGTSFSHTGLTPNSTHYYKLFSYNAKLEYSAELDAHANCNCAPLNLPYVEDIEQHTMPECWNQTSAGDAYWASSESANAGGSASEFMAVSGSASTDTLRLVSPPINTIGYTHISLSFRHMLTYLSPGATFKIQSSNDGKNWVDANWQLKTDSNLVVPAKMTNVDIVHNINNLQSRIAFVIEGDLSKFGRWYVDDIMLTGSTIPIATISSDAPTINLQDTVTISANIIGNVDSVEWHFGEGATPFTSSVLSSNRITYNTPGYKTISIKVNGKHVFEQENMIYVTNNQYVAPKSLISHVKDSSVILNWLAPSDTLSELHEDFENYPAFSLNFSPWQQIDSDKTATISVSNFNFLNENYTGSFIIFDKDNTNPVANSLWSAYSGNKFAACFSSNVLQGSPNNDWLISPTIRIGSDYQLQFMAKSISSTYGLERFEVAIATESAGIDSFTTISGSNSIEAPTSWTSYTYNLSNYANQLVRVAIRCVSNDAFVFGVDQINIAPKTSQLTNIEYNTNAANKASRYKIYRNGTLIYTTATAQQLAFTDSTLRDSTYNYYVTAIYGDTAESAPSNIAKANVLTNKYFNLNMQVEGNGTTNIIQADTQLVANQKYTLIATANNGWQLAKWKINGKYFYQNNLTITMNSDKNVVAEFVPLAQPSFSLTVEKAENGISSLLSGIYNFNVTNNQIIKAIPNSGWQFEKWIINGNDNYQNPTTLQFDKNFSVLPVFKEKEYNVVVNQEGTGTIKPEIGSYTATPNEQFSLSATPARAWIFSKWIIDGVEYANSDTTITISSDIQAVAIFQNQTNATVIQANTSAIYPNPCSNDFYILSEENMLNVWVYNSIGKTIAQKNNALSKTIHFNSSSWLKGIYIIRTENVKHEFQTFKLVKN